MHNLCDRYSLNGSHHRAWQQLPYLSWIARQRPLLRSERSSAIRQDTHNFRITDAHQWGAHSLSVGNRSYQKRGGQSQRRGGRIRSYSERRSAKIGSRHLPVYRHRSRVFRRKPPPLLRPSPRPSPTQLEMTVGGSWPFIHEKKVTVDFLSRDRL